MPREQEESGAGPRHSAPDALQQDEALRDRALNFWRDGLRPVRNISVDATEGVPPPCPPLVTSKKFWPTPSMAFPQRARNDRPTRFHSTRNSSRSRNIASAFAINRGAAAGKSARFALSCSMLCCVISLYW